MQICPALAATAFLCDLKRNVVPPSGGVELRMLKGSTAFLKTK
jgi:hypothetical protein